MKLRTLSKSDIKNLNKDLFNLFGFEPLNKKDNVQLFEEEISGLKINGVVEYFYYNEILLPTLKNLLKNNFLKKVVVDMGAVKFVCNGADLMRPGITNFDENIKKDDFVVVVDETHNKPLCIAISLFSSEELKIQEKGKSLKNIHFIGDDIWNIN
ncbi:RNA-binding protein [Candidatus Woesearchaeota archaeon]|nr:RNA-binding protein [Candidatus Woesearchaeota archaeon]MCF8013588.1 RNA-binding protein [Candidatus Woesearchaeota archaeon]